MQLFNRCLSYSTSALTSSRHKVAIVGSGPAGFYVAHRLLQQMKPANGELEIDLIEAMPVPYGLVRFGIAPDHQEAKNVEHKFARVAEHPAVRFWGNVKLGRDVSVSELRSMFDSVVFAYGASRDKPLNVRGENDGMAGIYGSKEFVGWYNGSPWLRDIKQLSETDTAVVVGMGNVALDIGRVLLSSVDQLRHTDITESALESLKHSRIKRVILLGRRGPVQVSFTAKELREMSKIAGIRHHVDRITVERELLSHAEELKTNRARAKIVSLLHSIAANSNSNEILCDCEWHLKFFRSPVSFNADPSRNTVKSVTCAVNAPQDGNSSTVTQTAARETIETGLVVKSIGYELAPVLGLPFDTQRSAVPNDQGRVLNADNDEVVDGVYVAGWLKTGPRGTIATTMMESFQTADAIVQDISDLTRESKQGRSALSHLLKSRSVNTISFRDWTVIEAEERRRGELKGKPREKIVDLQEILRLLNRL